MVVLLIFLYCAFAATVFHFAWKFFFWLADKFVGLF